MSPARSGGVQLCSHRVHRRNQPRRGHASTNCWPAVKKGKVVERDGGGTRAYRRHTNRYPGIRGTVGGSAFRSSYCSFCAWNALFPRKFPETCFHTECLISKRISGNVWKPQSAGGKVVVKQDTSAGRVRAAGKSSSPPCPEPGPSQRSAGAHARLADLIEAAAAACSRHIIVISASVRERWMRRRARPSALRRPRRARGRISRRGRPCAPFVLGSVRRNYERGLIFMGATLSVPATL